MEERAAEERAAEERVAEERAAEERAAVLRSLLLLVLLLFHGSGGQIMTQQGGQSVTIGLGGCGAEWYE